MPKISIIVPVYKVEQYLPRCIDSILAQTFTNFELILVDDGSPDNSGKICDQYSLKDSRIKVIHKDNGGQCTARNAGIEIATGEYIGFVDSDDWVDVDYYSNMYDQITKYNADICVSNRKVFNEQYSEIYRTDFAEDISYKIESFSNWFVERFFLYTPSSCNKLYRKDCIANIRFPDIKKYGSEDFVFNFKVMICAKTICEAPGVYSDNLARVGSTARRYIEGEIQRNINLYYKCIRIAEEHFLCDEYLRAVLMYVFHFFFLRSIKQFKAFALDPKETFDQEIGNTYAELRKIAKDQHRNKYFSIVLKKYGYRNRGIWFTKLIYRTLSLKNSSLAKWLLYSYLK